ncbi:hypothetical protein ACFQGA_11710 [Marinobacter koreensis]|uniref:Uncharacterized protein n=1 Tax=Marinobacter koreensis TaxID=335974 RepID=A0ABW0RGE4_9GAMM|nr:hypothetical protein [Marinobacter koreensis]MCK7548446.1 hypothetical protein [Marinobacter koreensis]
MEKVKSYDIEIVNSWFDVIVYEKSYGSGFVGEYSGISPKATQVKPAGGHTPIMKERGGGTVTGYDLEQVVQQCFVEIEKIDGEIVRSIERNE